VVTNIRSNNNNNNNNNNNFSTSTTATTTNSNQQAGPIIVHKPIYYTAHTDEFTTFLQHTGYDKGIKPVFYATLHSLMMGQ
jgi:hypothetical protein